MVYFVFMFTILLLLVTVDEHNFLHLVRILCYCDFKCAYFTCHVDRRVWNTDGIIRISTNRSCLRKTCPSVTLFPTDPTLDAGPTSWMSEESAAVLFAVVVDGAFSISEHIESNIILISAVGIATCYRLDGPGIEFRCERDFPHPSKTTLGQPSLL